MRLVGSPPPKLPARCGFHPQVFGPHGWNIGQQRDGRVNVDGGKLNDVVAVLNAHGWGMAWFGEQDAKGNRSSAT
jgi:hypothetical protein